MWCSCSNARARWTPACFFAATEVASCLCAGVGAAKVQIWVHLFVFFVDGCVSFGAALLLVMCGQGTLGFWCRAVCTKESGCCMAIR
jgi:hypothetical protein